MACGVSSAGAKITTQSLWRRCDAASRRSQDTRPQQAGGDAETLALRGGHALPPPPAALPGEAGFRIRGGTGNGMGLGPCAPGPVTGARASRTDGRLI